MGRPAERGCLGDTGSEGGPALRAGPTCVRHERDFGGERGGGRRIPAHPYLAREMSDFGFRQTLKVRTLGCTRSLSFPPINALAH